MENIKIEVIGNIAKIVGKPDKIIAGTVGLPVEFTFDSSWDHLSKTAVFLAGEKCVVIDSIENKAVVPWEVLIPGIHLNIGVYGANLDGTEVTTTTWANAGFIHRGARPNGDPALAPTLPVWQNLLNMVGKLFGLKTHVKTDLVSAINEVYDKTEAISTNGLIVSDEKPTILPVLWFDTSED